MQQNNDVLFEKFTLNNNVTVPSRITVAPLTLFSSNEDGTINDGEERFLSERAKGIGLYILGATLVSEEGASYPCLPRAISEKDLPSLKKRADIVKSQGALAITQINHGGLMANPKFSKQDVYGPSAKGDAKAMTDEHIEATVKAFADATERCIQAGCDGVEIHGANNFLIQQFFSEKTNQRNDRWGGSLIKRMAFPLRVVEAVCEVREKMNRPDFIIGYRISPEEPGDKGLTMTETITLVRALNDYPLQYLHVSQWDFKKAARRGVGAGISRLKTIREATALNIALIGVGNLITGADLREALTTGFVDFVAVGQSIMMNPNLGELLASGKEDQIVTEIDLEKNDHYDMPQTLWNMCGKAMGWMPPVKGMETKRLDL